MNASRIFLAAALSLLPFGSTWSQSLTVREPTEDVNEAAVRGRRGLQPDSHLLFNGWGTTPAGASVPIGDLPLKLLIAPDRKMAVAVTAGFRDVGNSHFPVRGDQQLKR